jgi:hypothetical protein
MDVSMRSMVVSMMMTSHVSPFGWGCDDEIVLR